MDVTSLSSVSLETPVGGEFHMIIDQDDMVRASGFGDFQKLAARLPHELTEHSISADDNHRYGDFIRDYFAGDMSALDKIPSSQTGTEFRQAAWSALKNVPSGKTISYTQLAKASGDPKAVRVAGSVCAQNRLVLLIPCHRVIKSDGELGNYLYGTDIKQWLLNHEARFTRPEPA